MADLPRINSDGLRAAKREGARRVSSTHCIRGHDWDAWAITGHTGDWFNPHIVERTCAICGAREIDER